MKARLFKEGPDHRPWCLTIEGEAYYFRTWAGALACFLRRDWATFRPLFH